MASIGCSSTVDVIETFPKHDGAAEDGPAWKKAKCDAPQMVERKVVDVARPKASASHEEGGTTSPSEPLQAADKESDALRSFRVLMMGGDEFYASLPVESTVGDLFAKVSKERGLGFCFSLLNMASQQLNNPSSPLPEEDQLQCVIENPSRLCKAARRILKNKHYEAEKGSSHHLDFLRLGTCRSLGSFPFVKEGHERDYERDDDPDYIGDLNWPKGGHESAFDLAERDIDECEELEYEVYELTLLDGDDKRIRLIGVISNGESGTGIWGSVYLRPGLQEVGRIRSLGDDASVWSFKSPTSWYKPPSAPYPACEGGMFGGGRNAHSTIQTHFAHAMGVCHCGVSVTGMSNPMWCSQGEPTYYEGIQEDGTGTDGAEQESCEEE